MNNSMAGYVGSVWLSMARQGEARFGKADLAEAPP